RIFTFRFAFSLVTVWMLFTTLGMVLGRGLRTDRIAYLTFDKDGYHIFVVDAGRLLTTRMNPLVVASCCSSLASNGSGLAVQGAAGGTLEAYLIDTDTGQVRGTRATYGLEVRAVWSPDGSQIAYATSLSFSKDLDIWVMDVPSGTQHRLTDNPFTDFTPA